MRGAGAGAIVQHVRNILSDTLNTHRATTVFFELQNAARAGSALTEIAAAFMVVLVQLTCKEQNQRRRVECTRCDAKKTRFKCRDSPCCSLERSNYASL